MIPELPRYLHKHGQESLLVKDEAAYRAAVDDGWQLLPPINGHVIDFDEAIEVEVEMDEPVTDDPPKKKRGRPKKQG